MRGALLGGKLAAAVMLLAPALLAFGWTVRPGETLAALADRFYGDVAMEKVLVAANHLGSSGGVPVVPGMRLEVPALRHHVVRPGETWAGLAGQYLGDPDRAAVLAAANDSEPWLAPEVDSEIRVPYNLAVVVGDGEPLTVIAYRYLGNLSATAILDRYNKLGGRSLRRGDVVLVPLSSVALTEAGRDAARLAVGTGCGEAGGDDAAAQAALRGELSQLAAEVRRGDYAEAAARGSRMLATVRLPRPLRAAVQRHLTEALVALDAPGLATAACADWLASDPGASLDPDLVSPKIRAACEAAGATPGATP